MKRAIYILPVLLFAVLAYFLFNGLRQGAPDELPSALIGKPVPALALPPLEANGAGLSGATLSRGLVSIVNIWASWCVPCREEAPLLPALARLPGVELDGIVYKDTPANARAFLAQYGNPFARLGLDAGGRVFIEWGAYGVPETFIVDGSGIIRTRIVGGLTEEKIASELLPAIARAKAGN